MTKPHIAMRATAAIAALSLFVSGPAIAASQAAAVKAAAVNAAAIAIPAYSPWVMMSALASASSSAAVCAAVAAQATAAQLPTGELLARAPGMGCVLPQLDPPLAPATPAATYVPAINPAAAGVGVAAVPAGVGFLPIFLGLVSIAGIAMLGLSGTAGGARVQNSPT